MTKNTIDILVVTYNRLAYIKNFIAMLYLSTNHPIRIIVIDNGSVDGTREWLIKQKNNGVISRHIFNKENMKLAAAFTKGFEYVKSDLFITVADDMMPPINYDIDWLDAFEYKMNNDIDVGCINFVGARQTFSGFVRTNKKLIKDTYERIFGEC